MKSHLKIIDQIVERLQAVRSICVVGHIRPDGDCIGSQLGLTLALRTLGKKVVCWNQDPMPQKLAFLDPDHLLQPAHTGKRFDCVVATDAASLERLGTVADSIRDRDLFINIDHHPSNTRYADINWVSETEPSTGELIHRMLKRAGWPVTPAIANCLFTAVSTDTGSFQYTSTRPQTFQTAGELVESGANLAQICQEVYQSYPLSRMQLLKILYRRFRLTHENQTAYFWLKQSDFTRAGASAGDTEGLIDHIRSIEPVVVACVFEELEPDQVRISLRSKDARVDVNRIAQTFGGGGHSAAAGARIRGNPRSVQHRVLGAIRTALHAALK
ncbi:MAG: bifunctional oligoribonuclease/PAP phosphatase NrnA [Verrucomicrobia bacterium]|nr:bifunctional oligoribonuclease/PAP phosphatase NrnA [Verrucomicrobiota bacterium]